MNVTDNITSNQILLNWYLLNLSSLGICIHFTKIVRWTHININFEFFFPCLNSFMLSRGLQRCHISPAAIIGLQETPRLLRTLRYQRWKKAMYVSPHIHTEKLLTLLIIIILCKYVHMYLKIVQYISGLLESVVNFYTLLLWVHPYYMARDGSKYTFTKHCSG